MIADILVSINITNRNIAKARLIDSRISADCTLRISQIVAFLLFSSVKVELICNSCSSNYTQTISRLYRSPSRISLCGKCITKIASEKMKVTLSTSEFRSKRSEITKKYFSTEEGIRSSKIRGIKYSNWRNYTEEGLNHGKKCGDYVVKFLSGENSPKYNYRTPEFRRYRHKVVVLTNKNYRNNIDIINPNRYPRTLSGISGGYQIDHIKSVKFCFENGISPEDCSDLSNLQMLPWEENNRKSCN